MFRALRLFGVEAWGIFTVPTEGIGYEWRVEANDGILLLRQHDAFRSDHAVGWEHALRAFLAAKGWPVAVPLTTRDGRDVVGVDGERFSLYPGAGGRPLPARSVGAAQVLGRLLGRFHRDARHFPKEEQPEGLGLAWEFDTLVRPTGLTTLGELLVAFAREYPSAAAVVRRERVRLIRDLARAGYTELPRGVVHLAFGRESVLFADGGPVALTRFELAHHDALAFDLAATVLREAWRPSRPSTFDLATALAVVEAYEVVRPLEPEEWVALPALLRAVVLWGVVSALVRWWEEGSPQAAHAAIRAVERQLPAIEVHGRRLVDLAAPRAPRGRSP